MLQYVLWRPVSSYKEFGIYYRFYYRFLNQTLKTAKTQILVLSLNRRAEAVKGYCNWHSSLLPLWGQIELKLWAAMATLQMQMQFPCSNVFVAPKCNFKAFCQIWKHMGMQFFFIFLSWPLFHPPHIQFNVQKWTIQQQVCLTQSW